MFKCVGCEFTDSSFSTEPTYVQMRYAEEANKQPVKIKVVLHNIECLATNGAPSLTINHAWIGYVLPAQIIQVVFVKRRDGRIIL
jgi:hypothetical protein